MSRADPTTDTDKEHLRELSLAYFRTKSGENRTVPISLPVFAEVSVSSSNRALQQVDGFDLLEQSR
jgi:hypothetical protein